ncbi:general stress protein [Salipaludibacillus keqinensis]|uniref:General stress protein n=1 Tax=Salipaludibacillus keqinensis TaxID=2045207 RepID=A0A323TH43_9BACI|nr:pyridoxamine 5'-phosphate oxidase family protein [Salipaludibacillus keqinensis]PYZ91893.1 general stress protein [Salipaludibacillus keqinensis]
MNQQEIKNKAIEVLDGNKIGTLATVKDNKPHSRYMTFYNDDFTLFTPTNKETHKAEEIEQNPHVHILIGYEGEGYGDKYLEIEGKAKIRDSVDLKQDIWKDKFEKWFDGVDDPEFIVLEIKPTAIRLMNSGEKAKTVDI